MKPKYMIGTTAIHMLGDVSRPEGDLCIIRNEDHENYIGCWVTGFGFVEVKFPKNSTRELNDADHKKYHCMRIGIAGSYIQKIDTLNNRQSAVDFSNTKS